MLLNKRWATVARAIYVFKLSIRDMTFNNELRLRNKNNLETKIDVDTTG